MTCLDRNSHCVNVCIFTIRTIRKAECRVLKHDANSESSFQEDLCLIPAQLGDRLKDSKNMNRKVNRQRHVLTEETLDGIGERLEHTPQKSLKLLSQETVSSVGPT